MKKTIDGNTATALIAYKLNEIACIYPITPSSPMAELMDELQAKCEKNIYGETVKVVQMQSEGGVAGALHGALLGGGIATTFTSSQGLLLMIPDMYKIAGEYLPCVINVASRSLATHALNIFGDHSDIMATLGSGFAYLCADSVQACQDFALISFLSSFASSIPFVHFFDGFRTSHEIQKIELIDDETIKKLINIEDIKNFKSRALTPTNPKLYGSAQNADVYFQNRVNGMNVYNDLPNLVQSQMDRFASLTKRSYKLFDYFGSPTASKIVVIMGSGSSVLKEAVDILNKDTNDYGVISVRLLKPFSKTHFLDSLPKTVKTITVLERYLDKTSKGELTKEVHLCTDLTILSGVYGLGGKDFTVDMAISVLQNMNIGKDDFTIGINDDITNTSLPLTSHNHIKDYYYKEYRFYGLGSDGTVSANKSSIKIIGDHTDYKVQGYFEYDSKKSGSLTISHLKVSEKDIPSELTNCCDFIACHNFNFVYRYDMLEKIKQNGTFLLNSPYTEKELNKKLPKKFISTLKDKNISLYIINASKIAFECGLRNKINTVMQSAFFKLCDFINYENAKTYLKEQATKSYAQKGDEILQNNYNAIERGGEITQIDVSTLNENIGYEIKQCQDSYYREFIEPINTLKGNTLPVSAFEMDGKAKTGTSHLEKRGITTALPFWKKENCIQCGMCALSCPHACIRPVVQNKIKIKNTPKKYDYLNEMKDKSLIFRIEINPKDCTGCGVCANVCPVKDKALVMTPISKLDDTNYNYSLSLGENEKVYPINTVKGASVLKPYFEFSSACAGCGETPYIRLLTSLFGDKMIIANATGCSSIYGGSCPTCPYVVDSKGNGPAWANSLFEDNAEFGLGVKLARLVNNTDDSVWIIGGDGWAYDIGFSGLDHILSTNININILVLDSEVYSNTGGQKSKSTPLGANAKFAFNGKRTDKKPLAEIAMQYNDVYVAQVSLGNMNQCINAFLEAEKFDGVSLIIAYAPCINHGIDMSKSNEFMKKAVNCGYFNLFRYNGKEQSLILDSTPNFDLFEDFLLSQNRYKLTAKSHPELLSDLKQKSINRYNRLKSYKDIFTKKD